MSSFLSWIWCLGQEPEDSDPPSSPIKEPPTSTPSSPIHEPPTSTPSSPIHEPLVVYYSDLMRVTFPRPLPIEIVEAFTNLPMKWHDISELFLDSPTIREDPEMPGYAKEVDFSYYVYWEDFDKQMNLCGGRDRLAEEFNKLYKKLK